MVKKLRGKKGEFSVSEIAKWVIMIIVLIIIGLAIYILVKKGSGAIGYFKNLIGGK